MKSEIIMIINSSAKYRVPRWGFTRFRNKKLFTFFIVNAFCVMGSIAGNYGLDLMSHFEMLPVLDESSTLFQVSSHDRDGGNSHDGFDGIYSSLYRDGAGDYVLFDEIGSGCIMRIWMTFSTTSLDPSSHIRFYFDEDVEPRIDISLEEFFRGDVAPFLSPLVGNNTVSSGGYYCYLPFPFARRCRIVMSDRPLFYNISCQRINTAGEVESWTGSEDSTSVRMMWNQAGLDPKPTNGNTRVEGMISISSGSTGTLFSATGAGVINGLLLDVEPHTQEVLSNCWLRMVWDDSESPQVWAPLGAFFGCSFGETNVTALPLGMSTEGPYYCWFPMPYWESARIELVNASSINLTNVNYKVYSHEQMYDPFRTGWFHVDAKSSHILSSDGHDYILLETNGWGKVVGCVLSISNESKDPLAYLEGDERIYIDASATPQIYGTGTEDFFNGGWYFNRGPFSLPVHGHPMRKHEWRSDWNIPPYITGNFTAVYRFFLSDAIPFRSFIRFGIEHGYNNSQIGRYSSVVYSYRKPVDSGMVLETAVDVGNAISELSVSYSNASSAIVTNSWRYEGDDDQSIITDEGRISSGESGFVVSISSTNMGLMIRRRADSVPGGQLLNVYVDNAFVGKWYMPDNNFTNLNKRWVDAEFLIPYEYTAGKSTIRLGFERDDSGADSWNEYAYWVYRLVPLVPSGDMDSDSLPDMWETMYYNNLLDANPDADDDGDRMSARAEYVAGTNPHDASSVFSLDVDGDSIVFTTVSNRYYNMWKTTNLITSSWVPVLTDLQGNGLVHTNNLELTNQTMFYRVDVHIEEE